MRKKVLEEEIPQLIKSIRHRKYQYAPDFIVLIVNKRINQRFFEYVNDHTMYDQRDLTKIINPAKGTIVDSGMVEREGPNVFDFFLISQDVTQGSALPVHFFVALNSASMTKQQIEDLTYALCFNYYNCSNSIKVPSPCMYAHKIAKYAKDISTRPNEKLNDILHYI